MRRAVQLVGLFAVGVLATGCDRSTCAGVGQPAVRAHIRDALTGAPLAYRSTLIVREGTYVDSVPYPNPAVDSATVDYIDAAWDRSGTYSITVRREGSRVWTINHIRTEKDGCEFDNAEFTVRLQPAS